MILSVIQCALPDLEVRCGGFDRGARVEPKGRDRRGPTRTPIPKLTSRFFTVGGGAVEAAACFVRAGVQIMQSCPCACKLAEPTFDPIGEAGAVQFLDDRDPVSAPSARKAGSMQARSASPACCASRRSRSLSRVFRSRSTAADHSRICVARGCGHTPFQSLAQSCSTAARRAEALSTSASARAYERVCSSRRRVSSACLASVSAFRAASSDTRSARSLRLSNSTMSVGSSPEGGASAAFRSDERKAPHVASRAARAS